MKTPLLQDQQVDAVLLVPVGHVARVLESAGIPTVIIAVSAFKKRLAVMKPPRVLLTPHLMGRPLSHPNQPKQQQDVLMAALKLLINAPAGNQPPGGLFTQETTRTAAHHE